MITFLDKTTLLYFHNDQIKRYGGAFGIRDEGLLESALAQLEATFDGEYIHEDLFHMAAAYGFHLCNNHPFIDGNKRISLIAMYLFLFRNGYKIIAQEKVLYALIMDLASGKVTKDELTDFLRNFSQPV